MKTNYQDIINISIKLKDTFSKIKQDNKKEDIAKMDKLLKKLDNKLRDGVLIVDTKEESVNNFIDILRAQVDA